MFLLFLVSWIVLRHGVYNYIFYHAWYKSVDLMKNGQCVEGLMQKDVGLQLLLIHFWVYSEDYKL